MASPQLHHGGPPHQVPGWRLTYAAVPEGQIAEVLWLHDFEPADRNFVSAYLRSGMHVYNIGANVGLYTVLASILVGDSGQVHAFEPSRQTYERLLRNVQLNACKNVSTVQSAVSDSSATLVLRADSANPHYDAHRYVARLTSPSALLETDEIVETILLDDYVARREGARIDVVILDVEGAELEVLRGGAASLFRFRPTLLMECSRNQVEIEALLRSMGYRFWVWDIGTQSLIAADFQRVVREKNVVARHEAWSARS